MARQRKQRVTGLPADFPGREQLSLPNDMQLGGDAKEWTCATVYCNVKPRAAPGFARVNLMAGSLGQRSLVASAFVPQGFEGPVISASGIAVDGWYVWAQATDSSLELDLVLQAEGCCAEPAIVVPSELQQPPGGVVEVIPPAVFAELVSKNPAPWQKDTGLWGLVTDASAGVPPYMVPPGVRIVGLAAVADALLDGTITIVTTTGTQPLITIPAGGDFRLNPRGSLVGPATVTWTNLERIVIETVR